MEHSNNTVKLMHKLRYGRKNNLRQVLRNRYHVHMREKREELFDARRKGLANEGIINDTLSEVVRKEISDMSIVLSDDSNDNDLCSRESIIMGNELTDIEEELMREHEFILQEYEDMYQRENDMMNDYIEHLLRKEVICPICRLTEIKSLKEGLICENCNLKLPPKMSIEELADVIDQTLNAHNNNCPGSPEFKASFRNNASSINLSCSNCPYYATVI